MDLKSFVADSFLMLDGGMGTMLMQAGMPAGSLPELMNLSHPEVVTAVHKKYVEPLLNSSNFNLMIINKLYFRIWFYRFV